MKILQINCVYKVGSTGNIMFDIHKCLRETGYESVVIYGRGEKVEEEKVSLDTYKSMTKVEKKKLIDAKHKANLFKLQLMPCFKTDGFFMCRLERIH